MHLYILCRKYVPKRRSTAMTQGGMSAPSLEENKKTVRKIQENTIPIHFKKLRSTGRTYVRTIRPPLFGIMRRAFCN